MLLVKFHEEKTLPRFRLCTMRGSEIFGLSYTVQWWPRQVHLKKNITMTSHSQINHIRHLKYDGMPILYLTYMLSLHMSNM